MFPCRNECMKRQRWWWRVLGGGGGNTAANHIPLCLSLDFNWTPLYRVCQKHPTVFEISKNSVPTRRYFHTASHHVQ